MLRHCKRYSWVVALGLGLQLSCGFSLLGPNNEFFQVTVDGWNPVPGEPLLTAAKNIGEEYRRNAPFLYYTFDATFLDYFGSNGVHAVDQAMAILNGLTNVSSYSANLSEFPLAATRENYEASALGLFDIKSEMMHLMVEQLGLAGPERYTWALHDRFQLPG